MKTELRKFRIVSGPSREELFDGLRLSYELRGVSFVVLHKKKEVEIKVYMCEISNLETNTRHFNWKGYDWDIKFWITSYPHRVALGLPKDIEASYGRYSTKSREGTFTINVPVE